MTENTRTLTGCLLLAALSAVGRMAPAAESGAMSDRLHVGADPRIELLSAVQLLSDYKGYKGAQVLTRFDFPYRQEMLEYFGPHKTHHAVRIFSEMSQMGFWYGQPPETMLRLGPPPELEQRNAFTPFLIERAGGLENLERFVEALRDFAADSDFMAFYDAHRSTYDQLADSYRTRIAGNYIRDIEEYYGARQATYNVVLAPIFHCGGFGPRIERGDGVYDVYNLGGPCQIVDGLPDFGSEQNVRRLFWHEFSHSFVNHLTEREIDRFMATGIALMGDQLPPDNGELLVGEFVSEQVIRAVTTRLAYRNLGDEAGDAALEFDTTERFFLVGQLLATFETYEQNRDRYPTLADFYPEVVRAFESIAEEKAPPAGRGD